jgi:hypothetical protein
VKEKRKDATRDTYALALVVHADLLERDDLLRIRILRHEHLPENNDSDAAELDRRAGESRDWGTEIEGSIDAYPYVPSPICSSFSKQSTPREPQDGYSSRLSCPGAATAMASGASPFRRVRV